MINTRRSIRNEQSTINRNVGWREEPGCKIVEKKDSDTLSGAGVVCGMPVAVLVTATEEPTTSNADKYFD